MSVLEKQANLGRELFEINTHVARRMFEISGEGVKQYFATNQEFAQKLTEVRDVTSFVELQREYGTALYNGMNERLQTRGEVLKEAVERGSEVVRSAFANDEAADVEVEEAAA